MITWYALPEQPQADGGYLRAAHLPDWTTSGRAVATRCGKAIRDMQLVEPTPDRLCKVCLRSAATSGLIPPVTVGLLLDALPVGGAAS